MQKLRKILVPIDLSRESGRALRDAIALGQETAAQIIALHVIDKDAERELFLSDIAPVDVLPFRLDNDATVPVDIMLRERTLDLWNFVAQHAGRTRHERIRKVVRMGRLSKEITALVRHENIDLLVLKQPQRRWFANFATLKLVRLAGRLCCPVLLDPPAPPDRSEPKRGLLVFDLVTQAKLLWNLRTSEQ